MHSRTDSYWRPSRRQAEEALTVEWYRRPRAQHNRHFDGLLQPMDVARSIERRRMARRALDCLLIALLIVGGMTVANQAARWVSYDLAGEKQ